MAWGGKVGKVRGGGGKEERRRRIYSREEAWWKAKRSVA